MQRVPTYLAFIRIGAVIGMGMSIAVGLFVLLAGYWLGAAILLCALPFFGVMWVFERAAAGQANGPGD